MKVLSCRTWSGLCNMPATSLLADEDKNAAEEMMTYGLLADSPEELKRTFEIAEYLSSGLKARKIQLGMST
jgi:hypothetical protein